MLALLFDVVKGAGCCWLMPWFIPWPPETADTEAGRGFSNIRWVMVVVGVEGPLLLPLLPFCTFAFFEDSSVLWMK